MKLMKSLTCLLVAASVSGMLCWSQSLRQDSRTGGESTKPDRGKLAVERHFESVQPRPRPQFGGALPGKELLQERRLSRARLEQRTQLIQAARPEVATQGAALPGILMRPALTTGALPTSVATGDFNGDGRPDFVVANGLTNDLWIYLGKGDGSFQLPRVVPLSKGLSPVCVVAADLRTKGILDLVVAESDTSTIGVLLGNGDGTFGYETVYQLPEAPGSLVVDDFKHDGKLDIAAVMVTNVNPGTTAVPYIAFLSGDGTGHFSAPVVTSNWGFYSTAWNLDSGDVNGDGLPDLLITGPGNENSQIFINNGGGSFTPGAIVIANAQPSGPPLVLDGRLGDINGDGCADAVVADLNTMVWVALGDCTGKFSNPVPVYVGANNASVRLHDVNGDGHLDIITGAFPGFEGTSLGAYGGNSINVALGDGKGNFGAARTYVGTGQAYSIGMADFNGDGKQDFVSAESDTDSATVYLNDGSGGFGFPQGIYAGVAGQITINAPYSSLSFADLNGDGRTDAFLLDGEGTNAELFGVAFLNDGTGRFTGPVTSDTGISWITNAQSDYRLGDFRNTGRLDMIAIGNNSSFSNASQYILYLKGNGDGTFTRATPVTTAGAQGILTTGDFNRDGKLDFVAVDGSGSLVLTMFLGHGDGTFRGLAPIPFNTGAGTLGVIPLRAWTADFNRDGKLDVLLFASGNGYWTNQSALWEFDGNGDGTFQTPRQLFTGFQPLALADLNGDSYLDIARYDFMWPDGTTQTLGPAKFTNYLGQPDGTFKQSSSYANYTGVPLPVTPFQQNGDPLASSMTGDFKGSGKPDEVAFQQPVNFAPAPYAQFLMGNGDGTFVPTYDIFPFYGGYPLYAHDLNGDGIADMVQINGGTSSLQVFKGGHAPVLQIELEQAVVTGGQGCGWVFPDVASSSSASVTLSSSVSGVLLPTSITIPAGALSARFCYTLASNFDWRQVFDISAQLNGDVATAYASSSYVLGFSETISPTSAGPVYNGKSTAPVTVTLTSSQGYSSTVHLSCVGSLPGDTCQFASSSLDVSPGAPIATTVTFIESPDQPVNGTQDVFTVIASDGNVTRRQTFTVSLALLNINNFFSGPIQVFPPSTGSVTLQVSGIPPYTFGCSGLPNGVSCAFSGDQASYPQNSGISLAMNVPAGTPAGNYPFTVTASSQGITASATETLAVIGYNVQGPPAANDWTFAGTSANIPVTVQGSSNSSGSGINLSITCVLDVQATCTGGTSPVSATAQSVNLSLSVPAGTSLGQHQLTVTATANGNTQIYTFPVNVVALSGSLSNSALTIPRSGSGSLTLSLNATNGFSGSVSLSCSGASPQLSCSFNPSPVQLTGGIAQSITTTFAATNAAQIHREPSAVSAKGTLALAILLPAAFWLSPRRRRRALLLLCALCALVSSVTSCGSGGGSTGIGGGGGGGGSNAYSVTVNATAAGASQSYALGTVAITVTH